MCIRDRLGLAHCHQLLDIVDVNPGRNVDAQIAQMPGVGQLLGLCTSSQAVPVVRKKAAAFFQADLDHLRNDQMTIDILNLREVTSVKRRVGVGDQYLSLIHI